MGPTHGGRAARVGGVGAAAGLLTSVARKAWAEAARAPRRGHGARGVRPVEVEDADGRLAMAALRFLVVHSSQLAAQAAVASSAAQAQEAERAAEPLPRVAARCFACAADAEAARAA
jgi:hypothetical protein